jgi:hypothetical protein
MWQGNMRTNWRFCEGGRTLLAIGKPSVLSWCYSNAARLFIFVRAMYDFTAFNAGLFPLCPDAC